MRSAHHRGTLASTCPNFRGTKHQFQRFANRLNAERGANGERQIRIDSLRHLEHASGFIENDYDRLSNFVEENGQAIGSFVSVISATNAEINRGPSRILMEKH